MRRKLEEGPRETRQSWAGSRLHSLLELLLFHDLQRERQESPLSSACPGTHRKDRALVGLPSLSSCSAPRECIFRAGGRTVLWELLSA